MMNWLKNWLCKSEKHEIESLKAECARLGKALERAFYERDKALNRAARLERDLSVLEYEQRMSR